MLDPGPRVYLAAELGVYVVEVAGVFHLVDDRLGAWRRRRPFTGAVAELRLLGGRAAETLLRRLGVVGGAGAVSTAPLLRDRDEVEGPAPSLRLLPRERTGGTDDDRVRAVQVAEARLHAAVADLMAGRRHTVA